MRTEIKTNNTNIPQGYYDDDGYHLVEPGDSITLRFETHTIIDGGMPRGYTGLTYRYLRLDKSSFALKTASHAESETHEGHSFKVDIFEADFDIVNEIGVLFTTPNTVNRIHCVPLVYASAAAVFHILETPVIDVGNYPTTFYTPVNRDRNSSIMSAVLSIRAVPVVNRVSLKLKADTTPITGDGTVIHAEVIGAGKKGGGGGMRDTDEYIMKQNTNYYFRLTGTPNGADGSVASLHVNWFEHTDLE